ncbi:hypothetical protein EFK50_10960 [Nocardioides marmoriginsengisoli]|uniref:Uncharacterized protein n=1 Tax=Nocardioides marmoriginsengisoli TaxID=661483 RepID=A0A3N0CFQ9_9ACTN|nr:hypothetical protein [Nocardioides marmoriginsengisoli]RNL62294.1 hypothetical protein EFK50_10960 [Nocardioides marmoriginsengisoli]
MRKLIVVAVTAALVLVPLTAEAKTNAKKAYGVTATVSATTSEVGRTVKVAGKVVGKGAAGKKVDIQRKNGAGRWATVARAKVSKRNLYVARVKMTNGGKTSIRVIMPATRSARTGVSAVRNVTTYRWLSMVQQSAIVSGGMIHDTTGKIKGTSYPHSIALLGGGMVVKANKLCTRFSTTLGFDDSSTVAPDSTFGASFGDPTTGGPIVDKTVKAGERIPVQAAIGSMVYFAAFGGTSSSTPQYPIIGSPRLYCAADALPTVRPSEIDLIVS